LYSKSFDYPNPAYLGAKEVEVITPAVDTAAADAEVVDAAEATSAPKARYNDAVNERCIVVLSNFRIVDQSIC
jgi:hypothetical protein